MISIIIICFAKIFLVTIALLLLAIYIYFKIQYKYWESKNVPHCAKPVFPFGNLTGIMTDAICDTFKKFYDESKHEKYYGIWLLYKPMLIINDPDLIKQVLVENFANFHSNGSTFDNNSDPLFTGSLFGMEGSEWKNLRTKLSPIFSSGKLKAIFPLIVKCGRDLQDVLEESAKINDVIDVKKLSTRFILDVISSTSFGIDINHIKNPDDAIGKMMNKVLEPTPIFKLKLFIALYIPLLAKIWKLSFSSKEIQDFFMKLFRDLVDFRRKNNFSRNDLMQLLIELLKEGYVDDVNLRKEVDINKQEFTMETLASVAITFLVAGHETTSSTVAFALYELALNQEMQKTLRKEVKTILMKHNGEITFEAAAEMKYLGRVVNETLRKYPPGGGVMRKCTKEFKDPCSNLIIHKNSTVFIPVFGLHRDERYYPNPEKFDPDRFTEENKNSRPNYTYLPFGEGPRICTGQRYALLQIKVGLAAIVSKFQLEILEKSESTSLELDPKSLFLAPKDKLMLKISFVN